MRLRGVCSEWDKLAVGLLNRRTHEFRIKLSEPEDLRDFTTMKRGSPQNFRNVVFMDPLFEHPLVKEFFEKPHEEITELALMCSVYNPISAAQLRDLLVQKLPQLQTLELIDLPSTLKESTALASEYNAPPIRIGIQKLVLHSNILFPYSVMFITTLFQAVPETLELVLKFNPVPKGDVNFYHQHQTLMLLQPYAYRDGTITSLEFEHLGTPTLKELVRFYQGAKIRQLTAKHACLTDGESLFTFMATHANILETIQLDFSYCKFSMAFPVMRKLKTLCIFFSKFPFPNLEIQDYGAQFPSLRTFRIRYTDEINFNGIILPLPESSTPCASLTELELPDHFNNDDTIQNIERIFPNVRNIRLTSFPRKVICETWNIYAESLLCSELESRFNNYFDVRNCGIKGLYEAGMELYERKQRMLCDMFEMAKLRGCRI